MTTQAAKQTVLETGRIQEIVQSQKGYCEQNDLYAREPQIASVLYSKLIDWKKKVGAQDPSINNAYDINRAGERKVRDPRTLKDSI